MIGPRERIALWGVALLALICALAASIVSALNFMALAEVMEMVGQIQESVGELADELADSNEVMRYALEWLERLGR